MKEFKEKPQSEGWVPGKSGVDERLLSVFHLVQALVGTQWAQNLDSATLCPDCWGIILLYAMNMYYTH